jgi:hypothetical protein
VARVPSDFRLPGEYLLENHEGDLGFGEGAEIAVLHLRGIRAAGYSAMPNSAIFSYSSRR